MALTKPFHDPPLDSNRSVDVSSPIAHFMSNAFIKMKKPRNNMIDEKNSPRLEQTPQDAQPSQQSTSSPYFEAKSTPQVI